jgi:RimJ/RimL family protein N-acetyltransferase
MEILLQKSKLRYWKPDDAKSLAFHANNKIIADNLRDAFPHPYTIEDAKKWIEMILNKKDSIILAVEIDGNAVGGIGVHQFEDVYRKTAEIGYWLAEEFWNKGIISEAINALVEYSFKNLDIIRLQAGVFQSNEASKRVLVKCGFSLEAVHKNAVTKNNILMDELVFVRFK